MFLNDWLLAGRGGLKQEMASIICTHILTLAAARTATFASKEEHLFIRREMWNNTTYPQFLIGHRNWDRTKATYYVQPLHDVKDPKRSHRQLSSHANSICPDFPKIRYICSDDWTLSSKTFFHHFCNKSHSRKVNKCMLRIIGKILAVLKDIVLVLVWVRHRSPWCSLRV